MKGQGKNELRILRFCGADVGKFSIFFVLTN